jgi:energy-coupling factor transport system permease protein
MSPRERGSDTDGGRGWQGLDPLTHLVIAVGTLAAAVLLQGVICLLALALVAVMLPAAGSRQLRRVLVTSFRLALPLSASAAIVNVVFSAGDVTAGAWLAAVVVARVATMAGAAVLFYSTTRPSRLVASLRWHGLPGRATFVIHNSVAMIPRLVERAADVTAAQRARGLDTEGSLLRRGRGLVALAGPTVLGAVAEVETRTLAMESRGFTRPGRPTLLWTPPDSPVQRVLRWCVLLALALLAMARLAGVSLPC